MVGLLIGLGIFIYRSVRPSILRSSRLSQWLQDSDTHPEWVIQAGTRCGNAPFIFPTNGFIGFLWNDSFRPGHHHQGVDIFGGTELGVTPVIAAYSGYLTRLPDWMATVIVRIPKDPLNPGRQIWVYYTHMADQQGNSYISTEFPPDTNERFVEAGSLLGFQGNFSGDPDNPVGMHLHFSIVRDDGDGHFLNELQINNTLDPSPYLGLALRAGAAGDEVVTCKW